MALGIGKSLDASCAAPWMKTKAAMCCVASQCPFSPCPIRVKKVDFSVSAAYPISEVVSGNAGLHAELFALRNKSSLLHDGVALTYTRPP
jgi:hypothetical protein